MRLRLVLLGIAILAAIAAAYVLHIRWLGFPDGTLTELDRAERALFRCAAVPGVVIAVAAFAAARWRTSDKRTFWVLAGATAVEVLVVMAIDIALRLACDHGVGG